MPSFSYSARNKGGLIEKGTQFATDRAAATASLIDKGLSPILVKEAAAPGGAKGGFLAKLTDSKVKLADKVIFSRQFATMINAGVPITQSLAILSDQSESKRLKAAVKDISKQVEGGSTLANALATHPDIFNNIYADGYELVKNNGNAYQLIKIETEKILPACSQ